MSEKATVLCHKTTDFRYRSTALRQKVTALCSKATAIRRKATAMRRSAVTKPQKYAKNEVFVFSIKNSYKYVKRKISSAVGVFHQRHR
ncbi:hypothetical protein ACFLSV_04730 [Bacteroidota bacterium]